MFNIQDSDSSHASKSSDVVCQELQLPPPPEQISIPTSVADSPSLDDSTLKESDETTECQTAIPEKRSSTRVKKQTKHYDASSGTWK